MSHIVLKTYSPSRSLDTPFVPNTDVQTFVKYSINIQVSNVLLGTNRGTVYLETSSDNVTYIEVDRATLELQAIVSTQRTEASLFGAIPRGYYVRLRTETSGGASKTIVLNYSRETAF